MTVIEVLYLLSMPTPHLCDAYEKAAAESAAKVKFAEDSIRKIAEKAIIVSLYMFLRAKGKDHRYSADTALGVAEGFSVLFK